jgi:hypothetical protein
VKETLEQNISPPLRPVALSVLCIITFCSGFLKILLFFWAVFSSDTDYSGKGINGFLNTFLGINSTLYLLLWLALSVFSVAGAGLIWKLKKNGFYLYVISVSIAYLLPAIASGAGMMTIQRLFFTSVFIFFYGIHLKFMN